MYKLNGGRRRGLLRPNLVLLATIIFCLTWAVSALGQDNTPPKKTKTIWDHWVYAVTDGGGAPPAGASFKVQSRFYIPFAGWLWLDISPYQTIGANPIPFVLSAAVKHRVRFVSVPGYTLKNSTTFFAWEIDKWKSTGVYIPNKGTLKVNLQGISSGGSWTYSGPGGTATVSGSGQKNLKIGTYNLTFGDVTGYNTPAATTAEVMSNDTTTVIATYTPKPVSINIAMNPGSVNGGWTWSNDKAESGSGSGAGSFSATHGNFTLHFQNTSIWKTTTPTMSFSLTPGQSITKTGLYVPKVSTVNINITSDKGNLVMGFGPSWTLTGTPSTGGSFTPVNGNNENTPVSNVPFGNYLVTFHDTTSGAWTKPAAVSVTVGVAGPGPANGAVIDGPVTPDPVVGTYIEKTAAATINITSTPTGVLSHGPLWKLAGSSDNGQSITMSGTGASTSLPTLPYGVYNVAFIPTTSGAWITPSPVSLTARVSVSPDPVVGNYVEKTASFNIQITSDKGSLIFGHNPSWSLSGQTMNGASFGPMPGSGANTVLTGIPYGKYIVTYNNTTSGAWITPGSVNVTVGANKNNTPKTSLSPPGVVVPNPVIGQYIEKTNDAVIKITSDPAGGALTHGASWMLTGTSANGESVTFNSTGVATEDLNDFPYGTFTVTFKDTTSGAWNTPAADTLNVAATVTPKPLTGHYTEKTGSLTIAISSDVTTAGTALGDGAAWTMAGTTTNGAALNRNGTGASSLLSPIPWGSYTITFKDIFTDLGKPWDVPAPVSLNLNGDMGTYNGLYIRHKGSLITYLEPPAAVADGAQWRLFNSPGWRNSGATVTGIPTGNVTVEFATIVGWETPPLVGVTINKDSLTTLNTIYQKKPGPTGSIQVTGEDKRLEKIGFWRPKLDGVGLAATKYYKGGEIVHGIPKGNVQIEFKTVPGLVLPDFNSLKVRPGITNSAEANYFRPMVVHKSDYDGNGTEDMAVFNVKSRKWSVASAAGGTGGSSPAAKMILERKFGKKTDIPTPGDYDGDGRADLSAYDELKEEWKVFKNKEASIKKFGTEGDIPVPGDYTGDGKTQPALFRPSNGKWYIYDYDKEKVIEYAFGIAGDVPVPGNWDGDVDGMTDLAVYNVKTHKWRVAIWNEKKKKWLPSKKYGASYGQDGDVPIQADYDGDGKTDIAVYRREGSTWMVRKQFDLEFGEEGDIPVPNDWAGLGRVIPAVFRVTNGKWIAVDNLLSAKHGAGGMPLVSGR